MNTRKSNPQTPQTVTKGELIGKDHIIKEKKKVIISREKAGYCYNAVTLYWERGNRNDITNDSNLADIDYLLNNAF